MISTSGIELYSFDILLIFSSFLHSTGCRAYHPGFAKSNAVCILWVKCFVYEIVSSLGIFICSRVSFSSENIVLHCLLSSVGQIFRV